MNIAFDVTLSAVVRVDVPDDLPYEQALVLAEKATLEIVDCLDVGLVVNLTIDGHSVTLTMTEATHCDEGLSDPIEINHEAV